MLTKAKPEGAPEDAARSPVIVRVGAVAWPVAMPDGIVVLPPDPERVRTGVRRKATKMVDTQE